MKNEDISFRTLIGLSIALCIMCAFTAKGQYTSADQCLPVLAKDYYKYAQQNNLKEDYLRSIDSESWTEMKKNNAVGFSLFDVFSLTDDYSTFDSKRTKYLESLHYTRNQSQALDILQLVTSHRAYEAYEKCLQSVKSGVLVWANHQTLDKIYLRVRFNNPPGVASMKLRATIVGGNVTGVSSGHVWDGTKVWTVNQEFPFEINVEKGQPETVVTVTTENGDSPVTVTFKRADALLRLSFETSADVLRIKDWAVAGPVSPNNDHRTLFSPCDPTNFVGLSDGKWCTNRTTVNMAVQDPFFIKDVRASCLGGGCPWSVGGPTVVSPNNKNATFYIDNSGLPIIPVLTADLYEHIDAGKCGSGSTIPLLRNQSAVFAVRNDCLKMAVMNWTILPSQSAGVYKFGTNSEQGGDASKSFVIDSKVETPIVTLIGYKYAPSTLAVPHKPSSLKQ